MSLTIKGLRGLNVSEQDQKQGTCRGTVFGRDATPIMTQMEAMDWLNDNTIQFFTCGTETDGFTPDVKWVPFINHKQGTIGYFVFQTESDDAGTYIYLNPSSGTDTDEIPVKPDVFVYEGERGDPTFDTPHHFYTPEFGSDA